MTKLTLDKVDKTTGEITGMINLEIKAFPIAEPKGKTKGYSSITIDDMFGVHGVSIIENKNGGLFPAMPQTRDTKGEYRDIFHPVTSEGRKALNEAILTEFAVALEEMATQKESTIQKLRDSAAAAKGQAAPSTGKEPKEKAAKKTGQEH